MGLRIVKQRYAVLSIVKQRWASQIQAPLGVVLFEALVLARDMGLRMAAPIAGLRRVCPHESPLRLCHLCWWGVGDGRPPPSPFPRKWGHVCRTLSANWPQTCLGCATGVSRTGCAANLPKSGCISCTIGTEMHEMHPCH